MKSRALRPPDITLPPPFLAATSSGCQQLQDHPLKSPALVRTPGTRGTRALTSNSIHSAQLSPLPVSMSTQTKRARIEYPPGTSARQVPVFYSDLKTPCTPFVTSAPRSPMATRSSSRLASSDEDSSSEPDTPPGGSSPSSKWTPSQDRILCRALDTHLSDPRATPFAGPTPPPTLVHRIAKLAVKLAKEHAIDLTSCHPLADIRKRIVQISSDADRVATAIASPVLRGVGMRGLRVLTERAISADANGSYFPLLLQSPFHESRNAMSIQALLDDDNIQTSAKRKFEDLEGAELEHLSV
ncbi:uncharacterized protein V1513DRAFT_440285 [Lipomyces chichibuensis]|uniref:uncharacterized protein n=1 Tax=Lipomyces chichibuensis TaxID=1546026 RepID=UPI00334434FA